MPNLPDAVTRRHGNEEKNLEIGILSEKSSLKPQ
jgi:hypothetical protein